MGEIMEAFALAGVGVNLVLTAVLLTIFVRSRNAANKVDPSLSAAVTEVRALRTDLLQDLSSQRLELSQLITGGQTQTEDRIRNGLESQVAQSEKDRVAVASSLKEIADLLASQSQAAQVAHENLKQAVEGRFEVLQRVNDEKLDKVRDSVEKLQTSNTKALDANRERIEKLTQSNSEKQQELQALLRNELEKLRKDNEVKLEKMRATVDEKLQGTLERRLGESFQLVSERLEQVQKGLGEMQSLASDVGGLKRVLTNVKSRGGWGEVQLSRQLEDMLSPEQFDRNVNVKPETRESVEFAVRLPGGEDGEPVYLPIDSKLPQEDYERLLTAQESGDKSDMDAALKALEKAIVLQAKTISEKYINPPRTTDFALMYLPTEGLFAEVIRQPGLANRIQNDFRVMITGPTTLMSLLNSLQMGFRTLVIEKRTSEVWKVLSEAKVEFGKYGAVWDKLSKQLDTAQKTVAEAGTRTRAVERKLRDVGTLEIETDPALIAAEIFDMDEIEEIVSPIDEPIAE